MFVLLRQCVFGKKCFDDPWQSLCLEVPCTACSLKTYFFRFDFDWQSGIGWGVDSGKGRDSGAGGDRVGGLPLFCLIFSVMKR